MDIHKHHHFVAKVKAAVQERDPDLADQVEDILLNYDGAFTHLNNLCLKAGTYDPWIAASSMLLVNAEPEISDTRQGEVVVAEGGQRLVHAAYFLMNPEKPGQEWVSGSQAVVKIMQQFGTPEQQELYSQSLEQADQKFKKRFPRKLEDTVLDLSEIEEDPSKLSQVQSLHDRRLVQKIIGLKEFLSQEIEKYDRLKHGLTAYGEEQELSFMVASESGGTPLGWLSRELKQGRLPEEVRRTYLTLRCPHLELPEELKTSMLSLLFVYTESQRPIRREVAIGRYQEDLDFLLKLPEDHPLIQKYGRPNLSSVRPILQKPEITKLEAREVIRAYPNLRKARQHLNEDYLAPFSREYQQGIARTKPLFMDGEMMKPDCLSPSVPMKSRLSQRIESAVLLRDDYAAVKDLLQLIINSRDQLSQSLSLSQFKKHLDSALIAFRKAAYLDNFLEEKDISVLHPNQAEELIPKIKGQLPRGKHYDLVENFELEHDLTISELISRMEFWSSSHPAWQKHRQETSKLNDFNLYSRKALNTFSERISEDSPSLLERIKKLIPYTPEEKEKVQKATAYLKAHPLFRKLDRFWLPHQHQPYLGPDQAEKISHLLEAKTTLEKIIIPKTLPQKIEKFQEAKFYSGEIENNSLKVSSESYFWAEPTQKAGPVTYAEPQQIESFLDEIPKNYTKTKRLPPSWLKKLKFLVSFDAQSLLSKKGLQKSSAQTWKNTEALAAEKTYIHNDLIATVENLYQELEDLISFAPQVISSGVKAFQSGKLSDRYWLTVTGTTIKDKGRFKPLFDEFNWKERRWQSYRPQAKSQVGDITTRIQEYNSRYQTNLKVAIEKV